MQITEPWLYPADLKWLLDVNQPIDLSTKAWRARQKRLQGLPHYGKKPAHECVRIIFEWCRIPLDERIRTGQTKMPGSGPNGEATDEEKALVRDHLREDPIAFIWHFAYYRNREGARREVATPTPGQLVIMWRFYAMIRSGVPVRVALLKVRQGGFSWLIVNLCAWLICFNKLMDGISAAQDATTTKRTFLYLKDTYDLLPVEFRPEKQWSNKTELILRKPDGGFGDLGQESSLICQTAGRDNLGTGFPLQICHFSETGKWDKVCNVEDTVTSVAGSIQEVAFTFIFDESTAKGHGTYWHNKYKAAKLHGTKGWNGYTAIFIPWFFDPRNARSVDLEEDQMELLGRSDEHEFGNEVELIDRFGVSLEQLSWRRAKIRAYPDKGRKKTDLFKQENPSDDIEAWLHAGGGWLAPDEISNIRRTTEEAEKSGYLVAKATYRVTPQRVLGPHVGFGSEAVFSRRADGELVVFRRPDETQDYIIGADVAGNTAKGDMSVAKVYQRIGYSDEGYATLRIAASWAGYLDEDDFSDLLWRLGWAYSTRIDNDLIPALLAWERTGVGSAISKFVQPKQAIIEQVYPQGRLFADTMIGKKSERSGSSFGIATSRRSKPVMLGIWKSAAKRGEILVDQAVLGEAAALVVDDDDGSVDTGGSDHFMASVMAAYAASFVPVLDYVAPRVLSQARPNTVAWDLGAIQEQREEQETES